MSKTIIVPNEVLLSRAVQTVQAGRVTIIPVKGNSMDPFIKGNKDCVELYPPNDLKIGDIVLAHIDGQTYILHRIFRFNEEGDVTLMGDGNVQQTEHCQMEDIKAKARFLITSEKKRKALDSTSMKLYASVWRKLLPIRWILLKVYRKFLR